MEAGVTARVASVDQSGAIERLKGLAQAERSEAAAEGRFDGAEWARGVATPKQLKALERARDPQHDWSFDVCGDRNPGESFVRIITPGDGDEFDERSVVEFWESALGDDITMSKDSNYVQAFALSAIEVWEEVSKHL